MKPKTLMRSPKIKKPSQNLMWDSFFRKGVLAVVKRENGMENDFVHVGRTFKPRPNPKIKEEMIIDKKRPHRTVKLQIYKSIKEIKDQPNNQLTPRKKI